MPEDSLYGGPISFGNSSSPTVGGPVGRIRRKRDVMASIEAKEILLKQLVLDESNVRQKSAPDVRDLEDSIEAYGILEPLIVRPKGKDKYGVVVGGRRFQAAKAVGLKVVPCIVKSMNDEQAVIESLIENVQRGDLDPQDEAQAVVKLFKIYKLRGKVGQALAKSETWVQERLDAAGLIETVSRARPRTPVEIPRDMTKVSDIARVAEKVYARPEEKAKLLDVLGERPREDVRRVLTVIKESAERGKPLTPEKAVEKALKAVNVDVAVQFDSRVSRALIKAAQERDLSWEDIVRLGTELWLEKEGFL